MSGDYMVSESDFKRCCSRSWWNLPKDAAIALYKEQAEQSGYALVANGDFCMKAYWYVQDEPMLIYRIEMYYVGDKLALESA